MKEIQLLSFKEWMGVVASAIVISTSAVIWSFQTFSTKAEADDSNKMLTHKLDRLENKIDKITNIMLNFRNGK